MRFVHAADIHLDSPLKGLSRYEGAPAEQIREATRRALENLVELCLEENASFLLIAGDVYDGEWKDYATGLFFAKQMSRLREAAIPVVLVRGNHDAASRIAKRLPLPSNVVELGSRRPSTHVMDDLGVAVHGQGFATAAVTDDLAAGYPDPVAGVLNVGLLHTSLDGREGHEPYAPTTLAVLKSRGYDYWALGHAHAREVVCEDPWVVFPGNLQGRHARETGPKGATLVTATDGRIVSVEHRVLDVVRWRELRVDVSEASTPADAVERVRADLEASRGEAEGRLVAARVVLVGTSAAHAQLVGDPEQWENAIRAVASDVGGEGAWVEKVRFATRSPIDIAELAQRDDAIGQLVRSLAALRADPAAMASLCADVLDLPGELRTGPDALRLDDPDLMASVIEDVEQLLLPRLLAQGDAP